LTYVTSTQSSAASHGAATSPAVYNWTGLYLGPNVGCGWSRFALSQFALADRGGFSGLQSNGGGCFVGGQLGYNYQFPTNFVAGIEADAAFADITGQGAAVEEATEASVFRHKIADFGTLRGRLGYAYGQALPYVTGGWAWARNSLNVISDAGPNTTATHLHSGWTLGAGIEYAVTPKWSVKGEYLYADLGSKNYAVVVDDNAVPPGANLDLKVHTFKLGANYHW
jgi:outer membrane immunogenic protein